MCDLPPYYKASKHFIILKAFLPAVLRGVIEHIGVDDFCTFWVVTLMITNLPAAAVSLFAKAFLRSLRWCWLPVLVVISKEHCGGVPGTTSMDLSKERSERVVGNIRGSWEDGIIIHSNLRV